MTKTKIPTAREAIRRLQSKVRRLHVPWERNLFAEIADVLDVDESTVRKWYSEVARPRPDARINLMNYLADLK